MKKIVMIEDNDDHAILIRRGLEAGDCDITHYRDGLEAVDAFQKMSAEGGHPDLVLLDLKLPGMDGFGVLERIGKLDWLSKVPVVMLTTSSRKEEIAQAYRLGARGYVVKSDDFAELIEKLKRVKSYWFQTVELPESETVSGERKSHA